MTEIDMNTSQESIKTPLSILGNTYLWVIIGCALLIGISDWLKLLGYVIPTADYLPLHTLLEFISLVVSFAVFAVGLSGFRQTGNTKDLFISVVFFATGTIDLLHTLSYKGMPDFIGMNTPGKAAAYWTMARLVSSIGLFTASFVSTRSKSRWFSPTPLLAIAMALVIGVCTLITHFQPISGDILYDATRGMLTPLKIGLEYLIIAFYAGAFVLISKRREWDQWAVRPLRSALLITIFAELAFTLYGSPYDPVNLLGHLFKSVSYYLILSALFVSSIRAPYTQLSEAKEELQMLYTDAREHRKEIERSFSRIGAALSSSLQVEEALEQISELAVDMLHADCSIVISLDKRGDIAQVAARKGGCHEAHRPVDLTLKVGKEAIEQATSVLYNDLESMGWVECDYTHDDCLRAVVVAPMIYENEALGVVAIYSHSKDAFDEGDMNLLEAFALHAAVAMHNAISYERESHIADVLQRSILNPAKITTGKVDIAHVYEPAMDEALVGGDFYDVIDLPGGRIAVIIGDVSGKGLAAAVHTAMAKYALRAYIAEGHSPAEALRLLDKAVSEHTGTETFITIFVGMFDQQTGELVYANAGHEPPFYCSRGAYSALDSTGPAVGLGIDIGYTEGRLTLEPGSILLLYTDGISEARKDRMILGSERLVNELLTCDSTTSGGVARHIYQTALDFSGGKLKDDVAILAVKVLG